MPTRKHGADSLTSAVVELGAVPEVELALDVWVLHGLHDEVVLLWRDAGGLRLSGVSSDGRVRPRVAVVVVPVVEDVVAARLEVFDKGRDRVSGLCLLDLFTGYRE